MFFVLSKMIYWLIMPLSIVTLCIISSFLFKNRRYKKGLLTTGIILLIFFSNPLASRLAINAWEPEPKHYASLKEYDMGIVLSGITVPNRPPFDRIQFSKGADRIAHAIELYHLGKIKKILISGGSGTLTYEGKPECIMIREFALRTGIPREDLLTDSLSRNTHENALNSSHLITGSNNLLITSAFHMYRASKCFEKYEVSFDTFPTDYYGGPIRWSPDDLIVPKFYAIEIWSKLIKEWAGIIAYQLAGYI